MATAAERKDEIIIAALLNNPKINLAAAACGISETQIYARLRNPEFKKKYDEARRELLTQAVTYLQAALCEAVEKMREIMHDPDASQQTQLNAAECLARNCLKFTEQADILAEIEELKRAVFPDE